VPKTPRKVAPKSLDQQLSDHLEEAESHLIDAVNLFGQPAMRRRDGYLTRLARAQESVTSLYAEELVRIRGPLKSPRTRRKPRG
jgi:hypothetical protein